jgi:hypothetical protein
MQEYKGFKIVGDGTYGYYNIQQLGSGAVPESLRGDYTAPRFAIAAIDAYEPKRGAKKHGETTEPTEL